jgi:hypothetical protein
LAQDKLTTATQNDGGFQEFISDPKTGSFTEDINQRGITPRKYMTDDQRFAADVLTFWF